jgi:hypothetical protein
MMATHPPLMERIKALEPSFKPEMMTELRQQWQNNPPVGLDEGRRRSGWAADAAACCRAEPPR